MAPLFLIAALSCLSCMSYISALPLLQEPYDLQAWLEWYQQLPELQQEILAQEQAQAQEFRQLKQWLEYKLSARQNQGEPEDPATPIPPQPKRGNYMTLCHFKICNMGRKRSLRQDMP